MGALKDLLSHPDELFPLLCMYRAAKRAAVLPRDPDLAFCYDILNRVSRSFAVVIQQLPESLRDAVCVFYLVLRGLDTVEDDMAVAVEVKVPLLRTFYAVSREEGWSMPGCGTGDYATLMAEYPRVAAALEALEPSAREVICDICARMGAGMADFIEKEVETVAEYDLYCHYVAGLVGIGLSQLFSASGLEDAGLAGEEELSNHMALLLQKTNIIRDYLEDIDEEPAPRMFWPREIWGGYVGAGGELADFKAPENAEASVRCLNALILDALRHVPHSLEYLSRLRCGEILRFCAIPQVMAIGTLAHCYSNRGVFEGVVKMRRGETAKVMHHLQEQDDVLALFRVYLLAIATRANAKSQAGKDASPSSTDPSHAAVIKRIAEIIKDIDGRRGALRTETERQAVARRTRPLPPFARATILVVSLLYLGLATHAHDVRALVGVPSNPAAAHLDTLNRTAAAMFLGYALYVFIAGRRP